MAGWDDLRVALLELASDSRRPLNQHPDPRAVPRHPPPYTVTLEAWADGIAGDLHRRFGDEVELTVGYLSFPNCQLRLPASTFPKPRPEVGPQEVAAALESPLTVPSGRSVRGALLLHNLTEQSIVLRNNGNLTAVVLDPRRGDIVGGFSGAQHLVGYRFEIAPGGSQSVPLLVGTASLEPRLGYAIPPGDWEFRAPLDIEDGRALWTPPLELTVTA